MRHGSEFLILRGYVSLKVLILEDMFHENNEFNFIAIPSFGFLLGVVTFSPATLSIRFGCLRLMCSHSQL